MREILEILLPWIVTTTALFALVHRDEARLSPAERARAWPIASRRIAVVYFGVVALPVHFARTRRTFRGFLVGLAWGLAVVALDEGLTQTIDLVAPPTEETPVIETSPPDGTHSALFPLSVNGEGAWG